MASPNSPIPVGHSNPVTTAALASNRARTRFFVVFVIAFLFAVVQSWNSQNISYEEQLIEVSLKHLVAPDIYKLVREDTKLQTVFIDYADDHELTAKARLALEKYGVNGRDVLARYGDDAAFQVALRKYGESIVPVVAYFVQNDLKSIHLQHVARVKGAAAIEAVKSAWARLRDRTREPDTVAIPEIYGPDSRGWRAISQINQNGYQFLGQFGVDGMGRAHWIQTERILESVQSLLGSGVLELERRVRLEEEVRQADIVWAAVDVVGVLSVARIFKALKVPGALSATQKSGMVQTTKFFARPLLKSTGLGRKLMLGGARISTAYLVFRYPVFLNGFFDAAAKLIGISPMVVKILGWTAIGLLVLYPFIWIAGLLVRVFVPLFKVLACAARWLNPPAFKP